MKRSLKKTDEYLIKKKSINKKLMPAHSCDAARFEYEQEKANK